MQKKRVLIDLRYLKNLNNGFGHLSLYYGNYLKDNKDKLDGLDISVLVPKDYVGKFGEHIHYLKTNTIYKIFPFLAPRYDVWHSITQSPRYFSVNESCTRIMTIHDLNFLYEKSAAKSKNRMKRLQENIKLCDLITVISNFTSEEIRANLDIKIPIIVNHVGLRDITTDEEEKPSFVSNDRKFFFTIGQMFPKKNFHVLVNLMELMSEYDLYICGQEKSKEYTGLIRSMIKKKKLSNVFVTGAISAEYKIWLYRNCYGFLFPSKFEGFGIPVIDAMNFEKPVFSSRMTSLTEIGDKYAFFWDNFEAQHMKKVIDDNIEAFYNNPEFIKAQREYGLSYNIDKHFENYLKIYRETVPKKGSWFKSIMNFIRFSLN